MLYNDMLIFDKQSAIDFLDSIGMDKFDIEEFIRCLAVEEDNKDWREEAQAWKDDAERAWDYVHEFANEVINIADNLATGKGGTKKDYSYKLINLCEEYT